MQTHITEAPCFRFAGSETKCIAKYIMSESYIYILKTLIQLSENQSPFKNHAFVLYKDVLKNILCFELWLGFTSIAKLEQFSTK